MNEGQNETFAVEMAAEVEMLRNAVAYLFARHLAPMSEGGRELMLHTFQEEFSDLPPGAHVLPESTRLHEAIAAVMPDHVSRFVDGVRAVVKQFPPGTI